MNQSDIGKYVSHLRFGKGQIVDIDNGNPRVVTILFSNSQKKRFIDDDMLKNVLTIQDTADTVLTDLYNHQVEDETILDASVRIEYRAMFKALNASLGTNYKDWRQASWPSNKFDGKFRVWFPQLADTDQTGLMPATYGCLNVLSSDWNTLTYEDWKWEGSEETQSDHYSGYILIFAKEPSNGPYIFRGVYIYDKEQSSVNHHVHKRIATRVKMIGTPAYDIELLDDNDSDHSTISIDENEPIVSFACGKTYDLVMKYNVHAHPIKSGFPTKKYAYLMARATGGRSDRLYEVVETIALDPLNDSAVHMLDERFKVVKSYINERKRGMGFEHSPLNYRFYILKTIYIFEPPYVMNSNPQGYRLLSFDDIDLSNSIITEYMKQSNGNTRISAIGISDRDFIGSLILPIGLETRNLRGTNRVNFIFHGIGFLEVEKNKKSYNIRTREKYLKAINVNDYELINSRPINPAVIWNIPYSDTNVLNSLISYIAGKEGEWQAFEEQQIAEDDRVLEDKLDSIGLEGLEKTAVVKTRINQGVFRERLIRKYKRCCLCGADDEGLLIASHIKPWSDSSPKERTDVENGLLLCPNHDRLFDRGYISFDEEGKILISDSLNKKNRTIMMVNPNMKMELSSASNMYMNYHRKYIFMDD